ncbi:MAG: hypothetical protein GF320_17805 [Armatimonadia bacterium]|nr:hypothetical protein [Armatimonadia bacterium]
MDYEGGRVKKNPRALIGGAIAILIIGGLVTWVVANTLKENATNAPVIGHSHDHSHGGGGGAPAGGHEGHDHGASAPEGLTDDMVPAKMGAAGDDHAGHDHSAEGGGHDQGE